ncbi:C-type natriuretic peptide 2 [Melanotaenia boesemani]|uniref:C-type natriuretic peptide 2 n=1 Tax=Melanotaenia boesemani TaxID=1250792 RepID=UPI001C04BA2C|nr:C-type natriuretic peptide 2 [Melanotaenia boesemani]XP_041841897.1 C-type natriuretic peptide 2 [Melanotaenia boesemani]XP_041841898.1 C-type natriuretic peptide 2 [Melanotaenia boesemani]
MAAFWSYFIPLLFLCVAMETKPSPHQRDDKKVLGTLFGSHLASLILAPPTSDDITESSVEQPVLSRGDPSALVGRQKAVHRFFEDFLRRQAKTRRRSRKSMVGGRGCFGMKMDRIGSISGLGC